MMYQISGTCAGNGRYYFSFYVRCVDHLSWWALLIENRIFSVFSFYCHCFSIARVPMSIGLHKIRWTKNDPGKRPNRKYIDFCSFQAWFNLWIIIRCNSTTYTLHYMFLCLKASRTHQRDWDCMIWNIVGSKLGQHYFFAFTPTLFDLFRKTNKQTWKEITNVLFRSLHLFFSVRIDGGLQGLGIFLMVSTQIEAFLSFWKSKRGKKIRNIKAHRFPS